MKFIERYAELSDRFAVKYAQDISVSQSGTTELFFTNEGNQRAFASAAAHAVNSIEVPIPFVLTATAEPNVGAHWSLITTPNDSKTNGKVWSIIDNEFMKIMKRSMKQQASVADKSAKSGGGSGTLQIANLG